MLLKLTVISVLFLIHAAPRVQGADLRVILAIFSGRRNPSWTLNSRHPRIAAINQLLNNVKRRRQYYSSPPARLGYKGFIVGNSRMVIYGSQTAALQLMLLQTMPRNYNRRLGRNRNRVYQLISAWRTRATGRASGNRGKRYAPPYNPAPWSASPYIERCNNCYNYANLIITNTTAQPGAGSGQAFATCTASDVEAAAIRDGLIRLNPHPAPNASVPGAPSGPRHLVALVVDPDRAAIPARNISAYMGDFHWYLLDRDGRWSHKPGETAVTRRDNDGNAITDPRRASMAPYQFVSFMTSNRNTVTIMDYEMFCF